MEYRSVRIKDVIDAINKDYFLPAIQREFVWEPAQIEKLFDSILGDYLPRLAPSRDTSGSITPPSAACPEPREGSHYRPHQTAARSWC